VVLPSNKPEGLGKDEASNLIARIFLRDMWCTHCFANVYEPDTWLADSGIIEEAEPGAGCRGKGMVLLSPIVPSRSRPAIATLNICGEAGFAPGSKVDSSTLISWGTLNQYVHTVAVPGVHHDFLRDVRN
jgi:hypothetical protein